MTVRPLPIQDKEYLDTLLRLERRAIIPLRWTILLITALLWFGFFGEQPRRPVLALFFIYALTIAGESLWFFAGKAPLARVRPVVLASYLCDVVFVTLLIWFDWATAYLGPVSHNDFYILYFLLVMRGFALFKTIAETIFVNVLISALFILMNWLQAPGDANLLIDPEFTQRLVLIWLVILMSWFLVTIINRQKSEQMEVRDRLLRAESLARIGEMAAGIAHEINNPIGIIAANADFLLRYKTPAESDVEEEVAAIKREAMRCKEIVQQLLTYANPRPAGKAALDLRAINDEVLSFVFPRGREDSLEIVKEYDAKLPMLEADPNLIKQALMNLYLNARQAIEQGAPGEGGRIVSRLRGEQRGRRVRIEVEDNGTGIAEEDVEKIFEPFFSRKAKGHGLGLSVTQRIIETFGGTITVENAKPRGAVFAAEFPAMPR